MGENQFQTWCASEGITCNPSYDDQHGWDFIVEVPRSQKANSFVDESPSIYECKVQVKASEARKGFCQISLQNLKNLLMSPLAVFFVFIEYGASDNPEQVFLVEFDETLAKQTLKRLRKAQNEGKQDKLNKLKLSVKYTKSNRLETPFPLALKNRIETFYQSNSELVSEKKANWLKTLGYEEGNFELRFAFKIEKDILELHRFFLGYEDQRPVTNLSGRKRRFGLSAPIPEFEAEQGSVGVDTSIREVPAKAIFKTHKYSSSLAVRGVFLSSELNKSIQKKDSLFRFKSPTLDILTGPSFLEIGFLIFQDFTIEFSFESLIATIRIAKQMYRTDQDIILRIDAGKYGSNDIGYRTENSSNTNLDWLYSLAPKVQELVNRLELDVQDLKLSIASLYRAKDNLLSISEQLEYTNIDIDQNTDFLNFPTKIRPINFLPNYQEKEIAILSQSGSYLGNLSIVVCFAIECTLTENEEGVFNIRICNVNLGSYGSTLIKAGTKPDNSVIRETADHIRQSYEEQLIDTFIFSSDELGKRVLERKDQKFELLYEE